MTDQPESTLLRAANRTSRQALDELADAAAMVAQKAEETLGGVRLACFVTCQEQARAFARARAKLHEAKRIVEIVAKFKAEHGDFS